MSTIRPTALRKAAILIASLDRDSASGMLDQMPDEQAQLIRETIDELGPIDPLEQSEVIEEFFRISPLMPEKMPPGIELAGSLARRLAMSQPDDDLNSPYRTSLPAAGKPFEQFRHTDCTSLAELLEREQPQIAAVVISHLPAERAAQLLAELPSTMQADVARRLIHLDETDPDVLREIEAAIDQWLKRHNVRTQRRGAGVAALRSILESADRRTQQNLLTNLSAGERRLVKQHRPLVRPAETAACRIPKPRRSDFRFADLMQFDDHALSTTLHRADAEVLILALAAVDPQWVTRIERLLPIEAARMLRYGLEHLGPIRLSDVEAAQQQLASLATQLEHNGDLSLASHRTLSLAV
jgi:flagellar motor switch protein FliG